MADTVLAKSPYTRPDGSIQCVTLDAHARDVLEASDLMFGTPGSPTRLATQWLRFFKLPETCFNAFVNNLRLAALFHDLGKANDGFQQMVRRQGHQDIRHEHLSALMLWSPEMRQWLQQSVLQAAGVVPEIVVGAVLSHHLKAKHDNLARPRHEFGVSDEIRVYAAAPEVCAVLERAAALFTVKPADLSDQAGVWCFSTLRTKGDIDGRRRELQHALGAFEYALERQHERRRLLMAVKAALLAVDSAGSAAPRLGISLPGWLNRAFTDQERLTGDKIHELVITPRVEELTRAGRWKGFQDFQTDAATLGARALLVAGCGSGKTLAAWIWAAAQLEKHEATRILFLYPTRATATEGFRDYVSWAGPEEAALSTGTARYDLQGLFSNHPSAQEARREGDYSVEERLFALAYWDRRVFSATVDSFIACMANRYAALCLMPLLVDSIVIVDEVHSFDKNMRRSLERMLAEFNIPMLCMTASLPAQQREALVKAGGLTLYPPDLAAFPTLERESQAPRYRVHAATSEEEALTIALEAIKAKRRVMWVVNTVARCQDVARELTAALGDSEDGQRIVSCFHSRFKLEDRKARHAEVIEAFKRMPGEIAGEQDGRILVTTQVCEMSLDLDADVLITELAPIPALIQRMGRCCRNLEPGREPGDVYAYRPDGVLPYTAQEIDQGEAFVARLAGENATSQAALADLLEELVAATSEDEPRRRSAFPDSGPYALSREDSFRDENDFVVDAVLDGDVEAWLSAKARGQPTDRFVVPVPRRHAKPDPRLGEFLRRAESTRYNRILGFQQEVPADA